MVFLAKISLVLSVDWISEITLPFQEIFQKIFTTCEINNELKSILHT